MKRYGKAGALPLAAILAAALLAACTGGPAPQYYGKPVPPQAVEPAPAAGATAATPDKGDPQQRFQAALKLMKDKQIQEAKDAFAGLAQDFPQYAGPLNDLGVLQAQGRQREQAIASFAKAIADNDADAFAYGWLGILYRESGDYPRSEQAYLKAIALKPDVATVHLNLGILYEVYLKQPDRALKQYREYQGIAGTGNLMVGIWIKQLESKLPSSGLAGVTPAGAAP
jgi:tetratricopeptide (TPR) repeat protein